jgi:outer membrane protein
VNALGKRFQGARKAMFATSKTTILALSLGLGAAFSTVAFAQGVAAPAANATPAGSQGGSKIGVVNMQEAIITSNEGKKEFDALQQKFGPKQAELKGQSDELDGLTKTFQAQGPKLNDDERATRTKEIEAKQKVLQRNYEDAQAEFQQAEQEVVNRVGQKMLTVLEKYANANGFAVVLDVSSPQSPVLIANQGTIITKELVDAYNAENGVAAPAAKPAAAKTPAPAPTPKKP